MARKYNYEMVKSALEAEGYSLLGTEYRENFQFYFKYKCPKGHYGVKRWADWHFNHTRCEECSGKKKHTFEFIKNSFEKEGYILLTKEYINCGQKLYFMCPRGHKSVLTWSKWNQGKRCQYCSGIKQDIKDIKKLFEVEGYTLLSTSIHSGQDKLYYICPQGHKAYVQYRSWKQGTRCKKCAYKNRRVNYNTIQTAFTDEGYILLTKPEEYERSGAANLVYTCPNEHKHRISWDNWREGNRCPFCSLWGSSKEEISLYEFICSVCSPVFQHNRQIIKPYEIDIVIPDKKIGIELCGLYWHSEENGRDSKYHLSKLRLANRVGYRLVTIFEDEWVKNRFLVQDRLKEILGAANSKYTVDVNECFIQNVSAKVAEMFINKYDLRKYQSSSENIGLFFGKKLLVVIALSILQNKGKEAFEVTRFTVNPKFNLYGVETKIFNYILFHYNLEKIYLRLDRRWADSKMYSEFGFKFVENIDPKCWYATQLNRFFRLEDLINKGRVFSNKKNKQISRIWDCGEVRLVLDLKG